MRSAESSAGKPERLLSPKEQQAARTFSTPDQFYLWELAREGNMEACGRLIQLNSGLMNRYIAPHKGDDCEQDLEQAARIGLLRAIQLFDPHRGFRFSTYACFWIRQSVGREWPRHRSLIKLPDHPEAQIKSIHRAESEIRGLSGCFPDENDLSQATGLKPEVMSELRRVDTLRNHIVSLDRTIMNSQDQTDTRFGDIVADPNQISTEDLAIEAVTAGNIRAIVDRLPPWQRDVTRRYYGFGEHYPPRGVNGIAKDLGLQSRHSVVDIKGRADQTLTQLITNPPESDDFNQRLAQRLEISVYATFFRRGFLELLEVTSVHDLNPDSMDKNESELAQLAESLANLSPEDRQIVDLVHGLGGDLPQTHWEVSRLLDEVSHRGASAADKRVQAQVRADFVNLNH